jgi:hypothetical protein
VTSDAASTSQAYEWFAGLEQIAHHRDERVARLAYEANEEIARLRKREADSLAADERHERGAAGSARQLNYGPCANPSAASDTDNRRAANVHNLTAERLEELNLAATDAELILRAVHALDAAPREWVDDADLFVKYTAWLEAVGG